MDANKPCFRQSNIFLVRLVTLFCFFHFSCLNSGFSTVLSSHNPQNADIHIQSYPSFVVEVVKTIGLTFSSSHWKMLGSKKSWVSFLWGSSQAIRHSSENIVQELLVESNVLEIWAAQSLEKALSAVKRASGSSGNIQNKGDISSVIRITLVPGLREMPLTSLTLDSQESWLKMDSLQLGYERKQDWNKSLKSRWRWKWRNKEKLNPHLKSFIEKSAEFYRSKFKPSLHYGSDSGEDDGFIALSAISMFKTNQPAKNDGLIYFKYGLEPQ